MLAIKLYNILGEPHILDLLPNTVLSMESIMPAFDDELEQGEFSLPINIPMSDRNRVFMGFPENLNSEHVIDQWRCDVYSQGVLILSDANLRILSHEGRFDHLNGTYSCNISGTKSLYGKAIKGKKLTDLELGGSVTWDIAIDSRTFAKNVMSDTAYDQYKDRFVFVPVVMQDYFDTTRDDYNNEKITNNTVNNIVANPAFVDGWDFGVDDGTSGLIPSSTAGYEMHRSIPFFKLRYVVEQCFKEHGWNVSGSFFTMPDMDRLLVYNTCSLEKYDPLFPVETGRVLIPSNHVPDISIYEFLKRLQNGFNLKIIFSENNTVHINLRENITQNNAIKDFSDKAIVNYNQAQRNPIYENGFTLKYELDARDAYWSDRVKDAKDFNLVATVNLFSDIAGLTLSGLDSSSIIFVQNENYYYIYNEITTIFEPYCEELWEYKSGKGEINYTAGFAPLCEHYDIDSGGVWLKMNKVAARQQGCYFNSKYQLVKNEFGLRLFFWRGESTDSYTDLPRSYSHCFNANGDQIGSLSLAWKHELGLYTQRWESWITRMKYSWDIKAQLLLSINDLSTLSERDIIQINNNQFVIKRSEYDLPLLASVATDLVKL